MKRIIVTSATAEEMDSIVDQLDQRHREEDFYIAPFDRPKVVKLVGHLIDQPDGVVLVAKDGERIVGCIVGGILERWFSSERAAYPIAFYILPEYRCTAALDRLLWEFQAQGLKRKARMGEATVISSSIARHAIASLQRTGFTAVAQHFAWAPAGPDGTDGKHGVH